MLIGIISDAHGNLIGLKLALEYLMRQNIDQLFFLGDHVGYFPAANGVIDLIRNSAAITLSGNHDEMMLGRLPIDEAKDKIYRISTLLKGITPENKKYLENLSPRYEMNIIGKKILLVHGSPSDPLNGYIYPDSDKSELFDLGYDYIFMGHTHRPFIEKAKKTTLVNVGSCGLPRDIGNLISVVVFNVDSEDIYIKRLELDTKSVIENYQNKIDNSVIECLNRR